MQSRINIGIIGAGRIGKIHAENIVSLMPEGRLKGIADINLTPEIQAWAKNLGVSSIVKDPASILADKDIQAVLICSSTDTHADLVVQAAKAGKHVFCEKPVDLTVAKVREALDAVKEAGVKLQVGFNRRFDHNFRHIRELVESGAIGALQLIKVTSRDPAPPPLDYIKVSGGIFLDMTIHDFDMVRFQAGTEVLKVYAAGAVLIDEAIGRAGDVDTAIVTLRLANGALAVIDNSRKAAYGYDQRVEVFGSKGAAAAENDAPSTVKLSNESGVIGEKPLYFFLERYKQSFVTEMRAFLEAVAQDKPTPVTGEDGLQDLRVGLAARLSLAEGRPIKLSEIPLA